MSLGGCSGCVCFTCLWHWSSRCPHGGCYDDWRARNDPWKGPVRESWSAWDKPGEQEHWCRGGVFFPADQCDRYVRYDYDSTRCRTCLGCNVLEFQDGYVLCSMIDNLGGCEACMKIFEERMGE